MPSTRKVVVAMCDTPLVTIASRGSIEMCDGAMADVYFAVQALRPRRRQPGA